MTWILVYQQCTGHLAQWTSMNNSARGEAIDEWRRRKVESRWEGRGGWRARGNNRTGEVVVFQDVSSRRGEAQKMNNQDETCWVNSERDCVCVSVRVCMCVFLTVQRPFCAALCRCLCTNTLGRKSRARLCYLLLSSLHPHCSISTVTLSKTHFTLKTTSETMSPSSLSIQ